MRLKVPDSDSGQWLILTRPRPFSAQSLVSEFNSNNFALNEQIVISSSSPVSRWATIEELDTKNTVKIPSALMGSDSVGWDSLFSRASKVKRPVCALDAVPSAAKDTMFFAAVPKTNPCCY